MREILFKAKRIDNGEWVEGDLIQLQQNTYIHCWNCGCREAHEIDEKTICQYTSLKDKNGNKIWENDVVECQDIIGSIGWNETHLAYTILASVDGNMKYYYIDESLSSDIEVIGNTFENSEMMKGGMICGEN